MVGCHSRNVFLTALCVRYYKLPSAWNPESLNWNISVIPKDVRVCPDRCHWCQKIQTEIKQIPYFVSICRNDKVSLAYGSSASCRTSVYSTQSAVFSKVNNLGLWIKLMIDFCFWLLSRAVTLTDGLMRACYMSLFLVCLFLLLFNDAISVI
jgi:hypothetical protein